MTCFLLPPPYLHASVWILRHGGVWERNSLDSSPLLPLFTSVGWITSSLLSHECLLHTPKILWKDEQSSNILIFRVVCNDYKKHLQVIFNHSWTRTVNVRCFNHTFDVQNALSIMCNMMMHTLFLCIHIWLSSSTLLWLYNSSKFLKSFLLLLHTPIILEQQVQSLCSVQNVCQDFTAV